MVKATPAAAFHPVPQTTTSWEEIATMTADVVVMASLATFRAGWDWKSRSGCVTRIVFGKVGKKFCRSEGGRIKYYI